MDCDRYLQVERHLEIIKVCVPFCILCHYFFINKCTFSSKEICWDPVEDLLEATGEQRNVLDDNTSRFQRAPLLTREDVLAAPLQQAHVTLEGFQALSLFVSQLY